MRRGRKHWLAAGCLCAVLSGCVGFWDEVTSRQFSMKEFVSPPEPILVLRTSTDGDARAKAFRRLKEPAQSGSPATQDEVMKYLTEASLGDPQPVCRMAAIGALGRFKDPRAPQALINAFESADQLAPDVAYVVRCQALTSLGETKQPAAGTYLTEIARRPIKSDMTDRERGQARDVRVAAVRSLRNFPNMAEAAAAAEQLAQSEKDIAVRDRARETYATLTGRQVPTAAPASTAPIQPVKHEVPAEPVNIQGTEMPASTR